MDEARQQIAGLGAGLGDIGGQAGAGFAGAQAAPLPSLEAPSTYEPATPWEQAGALASRVPRGAVAPVQDVVGRVQRASSGASGGLQGLGLPEGVSDVAGFGAGVLAVPGATAGASVQSAAERAGLPEAELQGDIADILAPVPGTRFGALTRLGKPTLRTAGLAGGPVVGGALGALTAPGENGLPPDADDRLRAAVKGAALGAQLGPDALDLLRSVPYTLSRTPAALGRAGEATEDVLGIRRGQRFRMPTLTPEEQAQRALDRAADDRILEAIRGLWRRGPAGEDAADELRLAALGKGQAGEDAARELLASRGLEDVLPLPSGVAVAPAPAGEGVLGLARRATEPLGARGAQTAGERAFDVAAGTAGGVAGAATADEDATWQERAARGALGASLGALGGANVRQLGRVGRRALRDGEVLGAAAGRTPPPAGGLGSGPTDADPLTKIGTYVDLAQGVPLASLKSLATNALGGFLRTGQRFSQDTLGNVDRRDLGAGEAIGDLLGMARALPDALLQAAGEFGGGISAQGARSTGLSAGGLASRRGFWPKLLTAGTRANVGTDRFWRALNEGGARGRLAARSGGDLRGGAGVDPLDEEVLAEASGRAGDFATFVGPNSPVADAFATAGRWARDPSLPVAQRLFGASIATIAPYVRTPERILLATGKVATDPLTQPVAFLRALKRGDETARREAQGRFLLAAPIMAVAVTDYLNGELRGAPPQNPTERKRQEAQGAQWNTWRGLPTRQLGNFGQAAAGLATGLAAAERGMLRGEDATDVVRDGVNAFSRWALSESYLDDLVRFGTDVAEGRASQALERTGVQALTRPLSPFTTAAAAFDETERAREGTGQELLYNLPGGRFALPERIDPATGGPMRRRGSPGSRYWIGSQGVERSPEGEELARYGISAPEYRAGAEYAGARLTGAQARALQRASGWRSTRPPETPWPARRTSRRTRRGRRSCSGPPWPGPGSRPTSWWVRAWSGRPSKQPGAPGTPSPSTAGWRAPRTRSAGRTIASAGPRAR